RIEKVRLVDEYNADDELSMRDNNSSSFNFRFISHTKKVSKHGLGLAVDINTLYNPYVKEVRGKLVIEPSTATLYTDRSLDFPYKIDESDLAYKLFTEYGFEWGGHWKSCKDYQHFELPDKRVKELYPENR
ncbi:MAG: M15 family metallopeptidase, partial [Succinivibrio sp.]